MTAKWKVGNGDWEILFRNKRSAFFRRADLTCLCRIFGHFLVRVFREKSTPEKGRNWNRNMATRTRTRTMTDECCHYGGSDEGWRVSKIELTNCHSLTHPHFPFAIATASGEILWHLEWRQSTRHKRGRIFSAQLLRLIALKMDKPEGRKSNMAAKGELCAQHPWLIFINTAATKGAKLATGKWKMLIVRHALMSRMEIRLA